MLNLTFGEQVKIVLSRKGMTIKELAEQIEERTGKKMSRQNLTQRLGRDNFQEQDMRMIAEILGCSFQLSILASLEAERASVIEEKLPTEKELGKLAAKKEMKMLREEKKQEKEIMQAEEPIEEEVIAEKTVEEEVIAEEPAEAEAAMEPAEAEAVMEPAEAEAAEEPAEAAMEPAEAENVAEEPVDAEPANAEPVRSQTSVKKEEPTYSHESKYFQPIKQRNDVEEDREVGDINPYTGREYQSNSVRMHPKRIGYVQVYDRKEHKWTDMTEWAFLGFEEQKKATLGKDYEPPIYLD